MPRVRAADDDQLGVGQQREGADNGFEPSPGLPWGEGDQLRPRAALRPGTVRAEQIGVDPAGDDADG